MNPTPTNPPAPEPSVTELREIAKQSNENASFFRKASSSDYMVIARKHELVAWACELAATMADQLELGIAGATNARGAAVEKWQPIETAPKDGTAVLGFFPGLVGYVARQDVQPINWSGWGGGVWAVNGRNDSSQRPTHWMPLPTPRTAIAHAGRAGSAKEGEK